MASVSKKVYIDKLEDIVNKYSNTYHSTIKMEPVNIKANTYLDSSKEINNKDPKFNIFILLKYQNVKMILQKITLQICLKKFLWLKKLKTMCRGHVSLMIFTEKKLLKLCPKKNCKKTNEREFRIEKVIKKKCDQLYVTWKGYNSLFNSWIDKKDII